jgi:tRNA-uridine 2-sulfurtransferase
MSEILTAVAMSGGVDSSTVAGLLHQRGHKILGLTMRLAQPANDDARRVAEMLGFPHKVVNLQNPFEQQVVRPFIDEYLAGRTPIPCARCNRLIKFGEFLDQAIALGAGKMATGHYARISVDEKTGRHLLRRGTDPARDQSYFLFWLTQDQLAKTLFPLGEYTKPEVRRMAEAMGLPVAQKSDSQEICFIPDGDYAAYIDAYFQERGIERPHTPGAIVSTDGRTLGQHDGVHRFTIGQRKGLGLATGKPLYVVAIESETGRVIVGRDEDLARQAFVAREVNWFPWETLTEPVHARVKIRNKHEAAAATVSPTSDPTRVQVHFEAPQRAVTPGQAAVFYDGDLVVGGGWIE